MADMKCRYCSKVCEITCRIVKYILAYKIQRKKAHYIISYNNPYNTNHFPATPEIEAILKPTKEVDYKSPYLANLDRKYLGDNNEDAKMSDIKYITLINDFFISKCIIST